MLHTLLLFGVLPFGSMNFRAWYKYESALVRMKQTTITEAATTTIHFVIIKIKACFVKNLCTAIFPLSFAYNVSYMFAKMKWNIYINLNARWRIIACVEQVLNKRANYSLVSEQHFVWLVYFNYVLFNQPNKMSWVRVH